MKMNSVHSRSTNAEEKGCHDCYILQRRYAERNFLLYYTTVTGKLRQWQVPARKIPAGGKLRKAASCGSRQIAVQKSPVR